MPTHFTQNINICLCHMRATQKPKQNANNGGKGDRGSKGRQTFMNIAKV